MAFGECRFECWRAWNYWRRKHVSRSLKRTYSKTKAATNKPFAVNLPLLYPNIQEHIQIIIEEKVPIVLQVLAIQKHIHPF